MNRNLDGAFFRVCRAGRWRNVCFSDLTSEERDTIMEGRGEEWLKSLCCHLADQLKGVGDEFGIVGDGYDYDDEQNGADC